LTPILSRPTLKSVFHNYFVSAPTHFAFYPTQITPTSHLPSFFMMQQANNEFLALSHQVAAAAAAAPAATEAAAAPAPAAAAIS
jgi:hypothetical protein